VKLNTSTINPHQVVVLTLFVWQQNVHPFTQPTKFHKSSLNIEKFHKNKTVNKRPTCQQSISYRDMSYNL